MPEYETSDIHQLKEEEYKILYDFVFTPFHESIW